MKHKILLALAVLAITFSGLTNTTLALDLADTLWQRSSDEEITFFRLVDDTLLLSGTELGLECLNSSDGTVLWKTTMDDSIMDWATGHIGGTQYLLMLQSRSRKRPIKNFRNRDWIISRGNSLSIIDVQTGATIWNSRSAGDYSVNGYYLTPDPSKLILLTTNFSRERSIRCIDFLTDELVWQNDSVYHKKGPELSGALNLDSLNLGQQRPVFDSDSTMITFLTKGFVRKWNWRTGDVIWKTKLSRKKLAPISDGFMQMRLNSDGTRLFVPVYKYLFYIDTQSGEIIWRSSKMNGNVYQVEETQRGLLVRGGFYKPHRDGYKDFLILLDLETGKFSWKKQLTKLKTTKTSNFVIFNDTAYIYSNRKLYEVSIPDGSYKKIAQGLDVSGRIRLFKSDDKIQLISGQTVAMMNTDATLVFNTTHELPAGPGFWSEVGTIVAAVVVSTVVIYVAKSILGGGSSSGGHTHLYTVSNEAPRFSELAVVGDSSICMITELESGSKKSAGIIRVRFRDGEIIAQTLVGDKPLSFTFSETLSLLFTVEDKTKITALRF